MDERPRSSSSAQSIRKPRILLAFTGSVAGIKAEELIAAFDGWAQVRVIHTSRAANFFDANQAKEHCEMFNDEDEWAWRKKGDKVLHIEVNVHLSFFLLNKSQQIFFSSFFLPEFLLLHFFSCVTGLMLW
jgi:phosphopantothenoylcysteine synthetase/decarboxylase